jgi:hypothetical protein
MVGDVIRCGGGKITVTAYASGTSMTGTVTQDIVQTVPNDPSNTPIPFQPGEWNVTTPVTSVINLNHLEGLQVTGLADGSVIPLTTVVDGEITLPNEASLVTVGLPYTAQMQTMYLDHQSRDGGTVQNRRKNISAIGLRVDATRGLQVGANQPDQSAQPSSASPPWTDMNEVKERTMFVPAGTAIPLYTGDYYKTVTSDWDLRGQVAIQQVYPLPANILSVISYVTFADDR